MRHASLVLTVLCSPVLLAQEAQAPDPVGLALDAWLDARFEQGTPVPDALAALGVEELERRLRAGRSGAFEPLVEAGALTEIALACDHVDYTTAGFLYVSKRVDPDVPTSLLVVGHGGNSAMSLDYARRASHGGVRPWIAEVEQRGWILVAPFTRRGWGAIGNSLVLSAISKVQRHYNIDPDRVFMTGHSMGGHLSWRTGISLGDRFGAVSPMSGGYDYVENRQAELLFNVPGYATWGVREPYQIAEFNRRIRDWMAERAFPWVNVEKPGGHQIFADELPKAASFLDEHPRDPYPQRVFAWGRGSLRWDAAPTRDDWDEQHTWHPDRAITRETSHWVRLTPLETPQGEEAVDQRVWAVNAGDNRIELTTAGVRALRLHLHPRMVDFAKPVSVVANGEKVFEARFDPDPRFLLELVREYDDRGRIFHAAIDVVIATDGEVPVPSYGK